MTPFSAVRRAVSDAGFFRAGARCARAPKREPRALRTFGRMRRRVRRRTARHGAGGRALRQATGLPAPPPPPPPPRACRHAFLISAARGLAPSMTMPAAFAAPPPPGPRCRPLRLYLRAATIKKTRSGRSPAWIFGGWAQPPTGFRIHRGVQCQMDRTCVYPGTNPATAFIHVPRPTTVRAAGTGPIQPPADAALTMMHRAPSPPAAGAADFRRHPLNRAPSPLPPPRSRQGQGSSRAAGRRCEASCAPQPSWPSLQASRRTGSHGTL